MWKMKHMLICVADIQRLLERKKKSTKIPKMILEGLETD